MKISTPQFPKAYREILRNNCNIVSRDMKTKTETEPKLRLGATPDSPRIGEKLYAHNSMHDWN